MKKLFLLFTFAALLAGAETFTGMITKGECCKCCKDHDCAKMCADSDCAKACAKTSGFVLSDGKTIYKLSDQATSKKFAAQKVTVTGKVENGMIQVERIEATDK